MSSSAANPAIQARYLFTGMASTSGLEEFKVQSSRFKVKSKGRMDLS
jgi:hypothetical protein